MRNITLGTVGLRLPAEGEAPLRSVQDRFAEAQPLIEEAGRRKVDFLCLPEYFSTHGVMEDGMAAPETVPHGPVSAYCSRMAKEHRLNLVTTLRTGREGRTYNTAVIFNRRGELAGTYDKVYPTNGENNCGGGSIPVFKVDGVCVGMQICFDLNFPEGCRALGVQGADIIFWPTMWTGPTAHFIDCIMRTRAMENFCFLVASGYVRYGSSMRERSISPCAIVGWDGCILAQTGTRAGLAVATVDVDEKRVLQGSREEHFAQRRPECYGILSRPRPDQAQERFLTG